MKCSIKTFLIPIVLGIVCTNSLFAQVSGDSYQSAKSSKSANLTYVYTGVNGFANKGADGNLKGLLIELMSEFESYVSSTYGITINSTYVPVKDGDFQQFLNEVKDSSGGVFGLNTTTIKEERKSFLKFSPAILNNISVLITNKSVPTLSSMGSIGSDFNGLAAYTASGSTYHKRLTDLKATSFPNLTINMVASEYDIMDSIIGDSRSFGFIDISFYLEYLSQRKEVKRHPAGDMSGEQYGIIMPLNSDWDLVMAEFLNSGFLKSTTYRQIVINNLGKGALRMLESN